MRHHQPRTAGHHLRRATAFVFACVALGATVPAQAGAQEQIESAAARQCDEQCKAEKLADGRLTRHWVIPSDGIPRTYWLYTPAGLSPDARVPLTVVLHGGMGDGMTYEDWTGFDALADEERFVVAYPDGFGRTFNARTCCFAAWRANTDDVGYMEALVADVSAQRPIDPDRVYATGHSNGAMLAALLACESDTFAAVAPVAGTVGPPCEQDSPVSVLHIHGTADDNVPYEGGQGSAGYTNTVHYPVRATVEEWRQRNGCPAATVVVSGAVMREVSQGCRDNSAVGLYTIEGGGHPWPGAPGDSVRGTSPSQALDASLEVWNFFEPLRRGAG